MIITTAKNNDNLSFAKIERHKLIKKYKIMYLMLIPGAIWFILFHIVPLYGIVIAFQDFNPIKNVWGSSFVGLLNFRVFMSSVSFPRIFSNTVMISFLKLLFGFPLPIIIALCLNEVRSTRFKKTAQTISYLPIFLSWVIVMGLSHIIFNEYTGVLRNIFANIGMTYVDPSKNSETFVGFLVFTHVWKTVGWGSIIYLSAIAGIDQEIYESAIIDGAGRWKRMTYITLPQITPTIAIILILSVGSILGSDFEQIYLFQGGQRFNPVLTEVSDTFDTWIYRNGIASGAFSVPAAAGIFQSIFGATLIFITNQLSKKLGYEGVW